jgi:ATP-dependent RNA circularization protein (DNA/RNA ligase family)
METKGRKSTNGFFKFPRTPHLFIAPELFIRDDKILDQSDMELFLNNPIILEEKVDGANIGISLSESGSLQIQNRGNFISYQNHSQFTHIWDWAYLRLNLIQKYITDEFIIFGEWCYAKHSIHYTSLPDWFLGFDIFDKKRGIFLNTKNRNYLLKLMNIEIVPQIGEGYFSRIELEKLLSRSTSKLYSGFIEGIYIRYEDSEQLLKRAKIVKSEFIQEIDIHWSNKKMVVNNIQL